MSTKGRSLELFFIDGRPDGMLTAEVFNWTGHVLRLPRIQLKDALARKQAGYTGVYILQGEKDGQPLAYIGEAEDLSLRLKSHAAQKDWWDTAVLITSAANNLHKAHVKYLESRLVEIADGIKATNLENSNVPPRSSLSEADFANMESFLETLRMVLPAIRVDMFIDNTRSASGELEARTEAIEFVLSTPRAGVNATALLTGGEMIVQVGSIARGTWVGDLAYKTSYHKLYNELRSNGVLETFGKHTRFTRNYAFSSPSAVGTIVNGRSTNGRTSWKTKSCGKTYADWEAEQLLKAAT